MSFRPVNDTLARRTSRTINRFWGVNYGVAKQRQQKEMSRLSDFDCSRAKLHLREGKRKNTIYGYQGSIDGMFQMSLWSRNRLAIVVDGILALYDVGDVIDQIERYYTWHEVKEGFDWQELKTGKTWNDLVRGKSE